MSNAKENLAQTGGNAFKGGKGEAALQHEKTSRMPIKCFGCGPKRKKGQHEYRHKPGNSSKHKADPADANKRRMRILEAVFSL